jgi:CRISPR-associated DxTHG motif protein
LNLKENTITAGTSGQYYRGDKTFQTLDKTAVGLGNVDNTSDANKPISSATQTALNGKLNLTGGTLTGDLYAKYLNTFAKTTYIPFDVGIGENLTNISSAFRGGTIMVFPDSNLIGSSANVFLANKLFAGEYSTFGSGMRNYAHQGGDIRYNSLALYTSGSGQQNTNRLYINFNGDIGINDDTPSFKLDVNGTLGVTSAATLSSTLAVTDAVTLSTTSATPTTLLGKDGSNVVGTVTTLEQTGLFGRGSVTNAVTDSNGNITVAHGFNFTPIMAFANLPGQTINIVNVKSVDNNNIVFVVRDGPTNDVLNTISVAKIEFFAIK